MASSAATLKAKGQLAYVIRVLEETPEAGTAAQQVKSLPVKTAWYVSTSQSQAAPFPLQLPANDLRKAIEDDSSACEPTTHVGALSLSLPLCI